MSFISASELACFQDVGETPRLLHDANTGLAYRGFTQHRLYNKLKDVEDCRVLSASDALAQDLTLKTTAPERTFAVDLAATSNGTEVTTESVVLRSITDYEGVSEPGEIQPFDHPNAPSVESTRSRLQAAQSKHALAHQVSPEAYQIFTEMVAWEIAGNTGETYFPDPAIQQLSLTEDEYGEVLKASAGEVSQILHPVEKELGTQRRGELGSPFADLYNESQESAWAIRDVWSAALDNGKRFAQKGKMMALAGAFALAGQQAAMADNAIQPYKQTEAVVDCSIGKQIWNQFTRSNKGCNVFQNYRAGVRIDAEQLIRNGIKSADKRFDEHRDRREQEKVEQLTTENLAKDWYTFAGPTIELLDNRTTAKTFFKGNGQPEFAIQFLENARENETIEGRLQAQDHIFINNTIAELKILSDRQQLTPDDMEAMDVARDLNVQNRRVDFDQIFKGLGYDHSFFRGVTYDEHASSITPEYAGSIDDRNVSRAQAVGGQPDPTPFFDQLKCPDDTLCYSKIGQYGAIIQIQPDTSLRSMRLYGDESVAEDQPLLIRLHMEGDKPPVDLEKQDDGSYRPPFNQQIKIDEVDRISLEVPENTLDMESPSMIANIMETEVVRDRLQRQLAGEDIDEDEIPQVFEVHPNNHDVAIYDGGEIEVMNDQGVVSSFVVRELDTGEFFAIPKYPELQQDSEHYTVLETPGMTPYVGDDGSVTIYEPVGVLPLVPGELPQVYAPEKSDPPQVYDPPKQPQLKVYELDEPRKYAVYKIEPTRVSEVHLEKKSAEDKSLVY